MICSKCKTRFGLITGGGYQYLSNDEELCYACMYQDDIEKEMLQEMEEEVDADCQLE